MTSAAAERRDAAKVSTLASERPPRLDPANGCVQPLHRPVRAFRNPSRLERNSTTRVFRETPSR